MFWKSADHYEYWFEYAGHYRVVCSLSHEYGTWHWMVSVIGMNKSLKGEHSSSVECRMLISEAVENLKSELAV